MTSNLGTDGTLPQVKAAGNVPSQKFAASPSRLFPSQTSVKAITDTQSAMRDNGDGLSAGARQPKPIQGLRFWS